MMKGDVYIYVSSESILEDLFITRIAKLIFSNATAVINNLILTINFNGRRLRIYLINFMYKIMSRSL